MYTKGNSKKTKGLDTVSRYGQMEPSTKVTGRMIRPTEEESSIILMATSTTENGSMIWLTVMESTSTLMGQSMKESGKTISSTDMVVSTG